MIRSRSEVDRLGATFRAASGNRHLADLGLLDVTAAPYHADPTGRWDSTTALQRAMNDARDARMLTYLPAGSYLVSDTIVGVQGTVTHDHWPYGPADAMLEYRSHRYPCTLIGARAGGRARLRLAEGSPGFPTRRFRFVASIITISRSTLSRRR
ncbi:MAG: glycosyl hydrolase family 28-related protein [Opitutaceae bacterium]